MQSKPATTPDVNKPPLSGLQFGIPAMIPGLLASGVLMMGAPVAVVTGTAGAAAAVAAFGGGAATSAGAGAKILVAVAAVTAGCAAVFTGGAAATAIAGISTLAAAKAISFAVGGAALVAMTANTSIAASADFDPAPHKYNPNKVFRGVMAGSALGAAITFAAAANVPQVPDSAVEDVSSSVLHTKTCGTGLCRDFNLAEQVAVSSAQDAAGRKTYTLTVPEARTLKL